MQKFWKALVLFPNGTLFLFKSIPLHSLFVYPLIGTIKVIRTSVSISFSHSNCVYGLWTMSLLGYLQKRKEGV